MDAACSNTANKKAYKHYLKSSRTPPKNPWTAFRVQEKYYKSRFPNPSLANVLDFDLAPSEGSSTSKGSNIGATWGYGFFDPLLAEPLLLRDSQTPAYKITSIPGLVVLPGFLSEIEQRILIMSTLREQAKVPNETNLDVHYLIPEYGLWNTWERDWHNKSPSIDTIIQPKSMYSSMNEPASSRSSPRELIDNEPASVSILPTILATPKPPPIPSNTLRPVGVSKLLHKLRWANIGRSYHWGTKSYDFSRTLAPFPANVKELCTRAVNSVPWNDIWAPKDGIELTDDEWGPEGVNWDTWHESYDPDAGIVNFYQTHDTLMGHVDRSELSSTTPLVSISLGNSAIFLIGGLTRDVEPLPILLRSGDVVIMSGPRCRRAFHGVPRILEGTLPVHLMGHQSTASQPSQVYKTVTDEDETWDPFGSYMHTTRINVNVRQVFPSCFIPPEAVVQPSS